MKKFLILIVFLAGCAPMDLYNAKIDRVNQHWSNLSGRSDVTPEKKMQDYWDYIKQEFPEHSYTADRCFETAKADSQADYDRCEKYFWSLCRTDALDRQDRWTQGWINMSNSYNQMLYQQQRYYDNLNQQNRSINCDTFNYGNYSRTNCR